MKSIARFCASLPPLARVATPVLLGTLGGLGAPSLASAQAEAPPHHAGMHHGSAPKAASAQSPFVKETMAKMMTMHDDMMSPSKLNGNADHDFLRMMIPHHKGALDMAEVYLKYAKDEKVKALAREIITAQKKEIALMEKWLAEGVGSAKK